MCVVYEFIWVGPCLYMPTEMEDDKIKAAHLGPSGEGNEVSPVQFSVKERNRNPDCYFFSLFNILQFLHNIQTAQFLCRSASDKV